ncbi:hypothetical protein KHQ08_06905 [Pseudochrobactrum algeriensis]|uniref:hypothetical protein n=1 Tax=Pseudochrobactrum algeriensis TaxID=2834768 RepID=UPI001BCF029E|nr:hypothetical protein [Pseudochrobactrum algeriensis]QVQ37744.1 hypothetical protein KHQ08_06905 [Pseudochrobactrum algeriensis]QVQ40964.1 hypothetical protein KHQ07_05205 [Pseudochrobactrum algeriensis]QVQ44888.1 hypothetical protein KHQ09_07170 [Pseudochrobactrum algeriensis]
MTRSEIIAYIGRLEAEKNKERDKIVAAETNIIRLRRKIRELKRQVFNASPLAPKEMEH